MRIKIFDNVFEFPKKKLYHCSLLGCGESTSHSEINSDPRKRWIIEQYIGDETEHEIVNLCPTHIRILFGMQETDYAAIELGEQLASNKIGVGEWKNAISSLRG